MRLQGLRHDLNLRALDVAEAAGVSEAAVLEFEDRGDLSHGDIVDYLSRLVQADQVRLRAVTAEPVAPR